MQEFTATKKYYIHEFKAVQDWFGNRGIPIERGNLREWCYDGHFMYFTCTDTADSTITPCDDPTDVVICVLHSLCYECDHEIEYSVSPFALKIEANHSR